MDFYIAQGISVVAGILAVLMMQQKNMRTILIFQIVVNLTASLNYLILGGDSGAFISLLAILQATVVFLYNRKNAKPHLVVNILFMAGYLACSVYNIVDSMDFMELLPAIAAICYSMSLVQEKTLNFRLWSAVNPACWLVYDLYTMSYVMFIVHLSIFISAVVGIIRLDMKKKS